MTTAEAKIVEGKAETKAAGRLFLAIRGEDDDQRRRITEAGGVRAGEKGGFGVWVLPSGIEQIEAQRLRDAVLGQSSQLAQENAYSDLGEDHTVQEPDLRDGSSPSLAEEVAEVAGPPATAGAAQGDDIGFGYRTGMSIALRDRFRRPVRAGSVEIGDTIETATGPRVVVTLSPPFEIASDRLEEMRERFPEVEDIGLKSKFQFANCALDPEVDLTEDEPQP